ncbi:MAG: NHLP family bacteriocin export ABC transporter peptidase/permease/ATPase subunit [Oscillospiraceae bacterium]|nr:NHLP family bacteriocin export ABC transporter peptidase/permease/ATPase subunit [Oscillospiraceae bacterium]
MAKKCPVILQLEIVECGAASLAMVMAYHKKWVPLERLRVDCGVSRDGSTAKGILQVARMYGFDAKGYRVEPNKIDTSPMPCVIHWNMNHFVVLTKITKKFAHINDPARGEVKVPIEQFNTSFTGIVVEVTPGKDFEPGGNPVSIWPFAKARLKGTAPVFAFVIAVSALASVIGIISMFFNRVFVDDLLSGNHPQWAYGFIALFLAFHFLSILLTVINTNANLKISAKFAVVSSGMFMWHALRLPVDFYSSRNAGDIAARQEENDGISLSLIQTFAPLFIDAIMMVFYLFIVLRYSVLLTIIGFSALIINYAVNKFITDKNMNISRVSSRDAGKLGAMTVAGVEMIETIKSAGAEDGFFERWSGLHATVNNSRIQSMKLNQSVGLIPQIVSQAVNIVILMIGAYLIIRGDMTIGIFFAFQGFLGSFLAPLSQIINARLQMQQMKVSMERVQDVFNYKADVEYNSQYNAQLGDESFFKMSGAIEIKDLTFGYNRLSPPLLEGFNLTLKPGGSVALVGASGCGKSTIAKLISNLYKPWSGEIRFDGKPAGEIPREIFTSSVSVVDQDIILFQDNVGNNIKTWDKSIEDYEVILAARDAQIHTTIIDRDGGYGGDVLESGKNFSGGERQRLEIAGALVKDPTIIIMDEATSALDAKTEYDVIEAVRNRDISMIVVAHRLSTIRDCDEIIVLDKGKVVQRGTHDELYAVEGKYKELVSMN